MAKDRRVGGDRIPTHETGKSFPTRDDANKGRSHQVVQRGGSGVATHNTGHRFGQDVDAPDKGGALNPTPPPSSGPATHDEGHRFGRTGWPDKTEPLNPKEP